MRLPIDPTCDRGRVRKAWRALITSGLGDSDKKANEQMGRFSAEVQPLLM